MSHQITLNSWFGSDPDDAAQKLAKVFRMSQEQSESVVDQLRDGRFWKFGKNITDHQAGPAAAYLQSLGFHVDLQPVDATDDFEATDSRISEDSDPYESQDSDLGLPFSFKGRSS